MKILSLICLSLFFSCNGQILEKKTLVCRNDTIEIELPKINKIQEHSFEEGKTLLLITVDKVAIEFYCGGNYSPHISDKDKYKLLYMKGKTQFGIDTETNLYWRKDGKLIYSNCKPKDTAFYNKLFNNKIIKN